MSFNYRYINKQVFSSSVGYTLILENDDNADDSVRIEKSFKTPEETIDSEFLRSEAKKEINRIVAERAFVEITEVSPDEVDSNG